MITKLTDEQQAKIPEYVEKWLAIGLSTKRVTQKVAEEVAHGYYEKILNKPTPEVIVAASPLSAWKKICKLCALPENTEFVYPYIDGQFSAGYFAFYNYINEVLGIKFNEQEKYDWYQSTSQVGLFYPLDDVCVVSDRPCAIHMVNKQLHADGMPSIEYTDGFKVYSLHGVRVPEWLAMTPQALLKSSMLLSDKSLKDNVEVRREFVKKIGVDRCLKELNWKVLDQKDTYELGELYVISDSPRRYLKMLNPSVEGMWHLEAVAPECTTVQEAINWRIYEKTDQKWDPSFLT
jgi:uncharacterized protein YoaH (UPF0181 family)